MAFDTDALRAFMTNHPKSKDGQLLDDIYERLERGELSVSGLRELLRMRKMAGSEVTMQDLRHILKVDTPKPTRQQYVTRTVVVGLAAWVVHSIVRQSDPGDYWITYGVTCAAIWFAYSVGVANASKLFPPHSKAATPFG